MVLGIWDYIENKIEVSSLTLCTVFQARTVKILRTALGVFVTDPVQYRYLLNQISMHIPLGVCLDT